MIDGANIAGVAYLIGSVISLVVGLIVLLKNPNSKQSRSFFLITLTGSLWQISYFFFLFAKNEHTARLALQLSYLISVPYISPCVYLFSIYFSNKTLSKKTFFSAFGSALAIGGYTTIFSEDIWKIIEKPFGYFDEIRPTLFAWISFSIILLHFAFFASLALKNLIHSYRNASTRQERTHKRYFLIGFFIGYISTLDFAVASGLDIYPIGPYSFSLFCLIIAYAIFQHQFLDIKIVVKKISIALAIYVVLFLITMPVEFFLLKKMLKSEAVSPFLAFLILGGSLGLVLSLGPIIYAYFVRHTYWLRGQTTTGLTHELKSPLTAIQSAIDIMAEEIKNPIVDKIKTSEYVEMIKKNTAILEGYVQDLLHLANIQDENVAIAKNKFDLSMIANDVCDAYKSTAQNKGLIFTLKIEPNIRMEGDSAKIRQVISNLLSNGIKFSESGRIELTLVKNNERISCEVSDTGVGIERKDLKKVFDRFFQAMPNAKGSGIGLTIAKAWIEAHGGIIWAESDGKGRGSKISFTLPV